MFPKLNKNNYFWSDRQKFLLVLTSQFRQFFWSNLRNFTKMSLTLQVKLVTSKFQNFSKLLIGQIVFIDSWEKYIFKLFYMVLMDENCRSGSKTRPHIFFLFAILSPLTPFLGFPLKKKTAQILHVFTLKV